MKKSSWTLSIVSVLALAIAGCMTHQVVTSSTSTGANGQTVTNLTTNTVVDTLAVAADCAVIQGAVAFGATTAIHADPAAATYFEDAEAALNGALNGASTNSTAELLQATGVKYSPAVQAEIEPLIDQVSTFEQGLLLKYGSTVAGTITTNITGAVAAGIAQGVASSGK